MTDREKQAFFLGCVEAHQAQSIVVPSHCKSFMEFIKGCKNCEALPLIKAFNKGVAHEIHLQTIEFCKGGAD